MLNKVILAGRLTHDPETVKSGETTIVHMRLAVDRDYKRKGEPETDFFDLSAFGKTAETCAERLHKGSKIDVDGRLQVRPWTDKDGKKRTSTEIVIAAFHFLDKKEIGEASQPVQPSNVQQMPPAPQPTQMQNVAQYPQAAPPAPQGYPAPAPTIQGYPAAAPQPAMAAAPQGYPAPAQPTAQYPGFPGVTGYPAPQYSVAGTSALYDDVPF